MTGRQRALLYLYSTRNIVGIALALAGLALYVGGVIDRYWPFIVVGLYLVGALLTPEGRRLDLAAVGQATDAVSIRKQLDSLVKGTQGRLPPELQAKVESIRESILSILPDPGSAAQAGEDIDLSAIRQTALDYLPRSLENYFALPRAFAAIHPVKDGKTASQLLVEQLDLMDEKMTEIADDVHRNDTRRLIEHGNFLEARFKDPEIWTH